MDVKEIKDQAVWDQLLTTFSYPPFTQLWSWGEAQQAQGKQVIRFAAKINKKVILSQWIQERRGPFVYWFAPQGPVMSAEVTTQEAERYLQEVKARLSGGWRVLFYRCEPRWRQVQGWSVAAQTLHAPFRRVHSMNPSTSFVVDLAGQDSEKLLESFHKKTQYNIRLAERHGVRVRLGDDRDWPVFLELMRETTTRKEMRFHSHAYLSRIYKTLVKNGRARLRVAEYQDQPLVMNLEILCGDTVMYLYGASSSQHRDKMAPFAMQWSALSAALKEGYAWYDFGGGNPKDAQASDYQQSWEGITRFKEQWGTKRLMEPGTFDLPRYRWLYRFFVRR